MLECPKQCCQIAMPEDVYCGICGTKLEEIRKCGKCGYMLFLSDVYCRKCGKAVVENPLKDAIKKLDEHLDAPVDKDDDIPF